MQSARLDALEGCWPFVFEIPCADCLQLYAIASCLPNVAENCDECTRSLGCASETRSLWPRGAIVSFQTDGTPLVLYIRVDISVIKALRRLAVDVFCVVRGKCFKCMLSVLLANTFGAILYSTHQTSYMNSHIIWSCKI